MLAVSCIRRGSVVDFFNGYAHPVPGPDIVAFQHVNIKPEAGRVSRRGILGHKAVFTFINIRNELNCRFQFCNLSHSLEK